MICIYKWKMPRFCETLHIWSASIRNKYAYFVNAFQTKQKMPRHSRTPHIYSCVAQVRSRPFRATRSCSHFVSRHRAICARSLTSKLADSLHLIIKRFCLDQMRIENRIMKFGNEEAQKCAARTKDVQALGQLVSVNWTHYCAYISDLSNS